MSVAKKTGNFFVWMIIVALIVGLGGFGITNFGGSIQSIGTVGDTPISLNSYYTTLQREIRDVENQTGERLTVIEAEQLGIVQSARAQAITNATLDNELDRMGLDIGDGPVGQAVLDIASFQGSDGNFDREAYRYTLQQNGLTEAEFEEQLRGDTARSLISGALLSGTEVPQAYTDVISNFFGARRSYVYAQLSESQLDTPVGLPSDDALQSYYEANAGTFTTPESRDITYALLTPDMLADEVTVDETTLRELYDERITEYVRPERRLVEQLVYPNEAAAQDARDRLDAGEASFDELVAERGLELSQIDLGDVTKAQLGSAGADVFALTEPGVAGPVMSNLGPALIRMNAILDGSTVTFEQAKGDLSLEIVQDRARRIISDMITDLDDLLAAGATLEELANDTSMELGQISYFPGQDADIAGYEAFRTAAAQARESDFPELIELEDGGLFALRLNAITPPALRPLDAVRDEAIAGWQVVEAARLLAEKAQAMKALLDAGDSFASLGLNSQTVEPVARSGVAPAALVEPLFALEDGGATIVTAPDGAVYLLQMTGALPADAEDATLQAVLSAFQQQAAGAMAQDIFVYFAQSRLNDVGLTLDEAAIRAVHAQLP
ncbi:peptidyl-prolyl cis-trans isomerase D [Actibacterium atlanticum]|uniref:Peptidyl-prolyl cis-trans isomerase D n=1 Tax=Actibacterium atlanticum TaxID=1461693 RepID=A0A058ZQG8_9RHOB|nr:peptidyl-prolyl cis-trans isomerase [Actibacterium atlanticum]KCV83422.1 peptidyl-prolyl cis-trans isomerase D [Actibacterium atlanticum]